MILAAAQQYDDPCPVPASIGCGGNRGAPFCNSDLSPPQGLPGPVDVQVRELVATLQKCRHQAFPVTPEVDAAYQSGARLL